MTTALDQYRRRMQRVLDHIDAHLDDALDLEGAAEVAAFSRFHFQRQFTATFGVSFHRYLQLARMKRASLALTEQAGCSVTEIAMDAGYEAPEAFSRAFRHRFGQSPSAFRQSPDWAAWTAALEPLDTARSTFMKQDISTDAVTIRTVPTIPVAIMAHRGDPAQLGATIGRFIAWRQRAGLHPKDHPTFTVWRSERRPAIAADYSVDLCVGIDESAGDLGDEVQRGEIPGGRCAVLRVVGDTDNLEPAALCLYRDWLPASGEEVRDFPIYCQRLSLAPAVAIETNVVDVFLPLK